MIYLPKALESIHPLPAALGAGGGGSCNPGRKALPRLMRLFYRVLLGLIGSGLSAGAEPNPPIDRQALVTRHDIVWPSLEGQIPLGNDLETVGGNTMCHWCWHSFPPPAAGVARGNHAGIGSPSPQRQTDRRPAAIRTFESAQG